ncbi:hypothetical protein HD554DRAFT_2137344 [Boletus coccyginus]|nr:hypothetical protein HD554DRAFT_2137344 [Boletus coccyginus]
MFSSLLSPIPSKYYLVKKRTARTKRHQSMPSKKAGRERVRFARFRTKPRSSRRGNPPCGWRKWKAPPPSGSEDPNDDDNDADAMDVNSLKYDGFQNSVALGMSSEIVLNPQVERITLSKEKLHARTTVLRRPGAQNNKPVDRDDSLLEERRKQCAALQKGDRDEGAEKAEAESKKDKGKTT